MRSRCVFFAFSVLLLGTCAPLAGLRAQENRKGAKFIPDDSPLVAAAEQGRKWAIVIGVQEYLDPGIPSLKYSVADARLVRKQLAEKCGYDPSHILLITDDQTKAHLRPLRRNLQIQVAEWLKKAGPKDTVLVFFSGHGFLDNAGRGFLSATDSERDNLGPTSLSTEELRDMLRRCRATQKVLVLDCCHAGVAKAVGGTGPSSQELGNSFRLAEGLITMASCRKNELSYEWDAKGHSLFTYFLAEGLSGAADKAGNRDGVVDSDELYAYTLDNVSVVGQQELNAQQSPVRIMLDDVVGRFALARVDKNGIGREPPTAPPLPLPQPGADALEPIKDRPLDQKAVLEVQQMLVNASNSKNGNQEAINTAIWFDNTPDNNELRALRLLAQGMEESRSVRLSNAFAKDVQTFAALRLLPPPEKINIGHRSGGEMAADRQTDVVVLFGFRDAKKLASAISTVNKAGRDSILWPSDQRLWKLTMKELDESKELSRIKNERSQLVWLPGDRLVDITEFYVCVRSRNIGDNDIRNLKLD
jgi:Caspase domain